MASGLLFGLGLAVSGMVDPAVVLGFLDLGRLADSTWNPALAGVMAGAVPVAFLLYRLAGNRVPPPSRAIDAWLLLGAALFGLGWGAAGLCPGPGLAAWVADPRALLFVVPMLVGVAVAPWLKRGAGGGGAGATAAPRRSPAGRP